MYPLACLETSDNLMLAELYILQLLHTSLSFDVGHLLIPTSKNGEFISQCGEGSQHS